MKIFNTRLPIHPSSSSLHSDLIACKKSRFKFKMEVAQLRDYTDYFIITLIEAGGFPKVSMQK